MPISLPNLQANPVRMEAYPIVGEYIQGAHGNEIDFYNGRSTTILPGEPINVYGKLCFSKDVILPGTFGTVVYGPVWMNFLLNPAIATSVKIKQGDLVYFDIGLADATLYLPGYATNSQPTNGYLLGHAVARHATGAEIALDAGSAVAATGGETRIFVLTTADATTYGTVPNFLSSS